MKESAGRTGIAKLLRLVSDNFSPKTHNHDSRYYTENEVDTKLSGKANNDHNHSGYAASNHNHDSNYAAKNHNHDDDTRRFYVQAGKFYEIGIGGTCWRIYDDSTSVMLVINGEIDFFGIVQCALCSSAPDVFLTKIGGSTYHGDGTSALNNIENNITGLALILAIEEGDDEVDGRYMLPHVYLYSRHISTNVTVKVLTGSTNGIDVDIFKFKPCTYGRMPEVTKEQIINCTDLSGYNYARIIEV